MIQLAPIGLFLIAEGLGSIVKSTDQRNFFNFGRVVRIALGTIMVVV